MLAVHWAASAVYHMHAQHCMTPYSTHSTQPGIVLPCLLVASSRIHCPFLKSHLVCASSPGFCLNVFVLEFCLSNFFSFGGIFGKFWFLHFDCFPFFFCEFLDFFHFREFLALVVFLFCLDSRFGHGRAASTLTIGARQRLFWLTSFSPLASVCTAETLHLSFHPHTTLTSNKHPPHTHTLHTERPQT